MKKNQILLLLLALFTILATHVQATAFIDSEPNNGPATLTKIKEENGSIQLTFTAPGFITQGNRMKLSSEHVYHAQEDQEKEEIKIEVVKGAMHTMTFTIPEDKMEGYRLTLGYDAAAKGDEPKYGCSSAYVVDISEHYKHFKNPDKEISPNVFLLGEMMSRLHKAKENK